MKRAGLGTRKNSSPSPRPSPSPKMQSCCNSNLSHFSGSGSGWGSGSNGTPARARMGHGLAFAEDRIQKSEFRIPLSGRMILLFLDFNLIVNSFYARDIGCLLGKSCFRGIIGYSSGQGDYTIFSIYGNIINVSC